MRKALVVLLGVCLLALFVGSASAREIDKSGIRAMKAISEEENPALIDPGLQTLMASSAADTYCIVWYDFEQMDLQGWTLTDNTAQVDTFFHVDDFSGLAGGDFNRLWPLEGTKSLWCGARPGPSFYMCSWFYAPGYGNNWNQFCYSDPIPFVGILTWSFTMVIDTEAGYDYGIIEYDAGNNTWVEIDSYDDVDTLYVSEQLKLGQASTKLRFHFIADTGYSDQDGDYDGDGAWIIDEVEIVDSEGPIDYEDFEAYGVGACENLGIWHCDIEDAYGQYANVANNLVDKDPCSDNFGTQIVFFSGSSYPSSDYPGLYDTPFCLGGGGLEAPCQNESIISPIIDMLQYSSACDHVQDTAIPTADADYLGGAIMRMTVYRDLPLANLVFYTWSVRSIEDGCPGLWRDRNFVYYGPDRDYLFTANDISDLVGSAPVQMTVGVADMCDAWYPDDGDCAAHTPSPYIDNVRLYRYKTIGPSWAVRGLDIFQDTFPREIEASEDPMEEFCRADAANDIYTGDLDEIDPGDSAVVNCAAPFAGGLGEDVDGALVYCHVKVTFLGTDGKPPLSGITLEGDYGHFESMDGLWSVFRCDSAASGTAGNISPDKYCIDLNDELFTRGYMVEYYFKAFDVLGDPSTLPASAEEVDGNRYEFTCLPTLRVVPGVLYCDDFHGRVTFRGRPEQYYWPAFEAVSSTALDMPDRYDTNSPSSGVGNGVGAYVSQPIFSEAYEKVIFDSGDLNSLTINDGISDVSNDCQLLVDWLKLSEHKVGLLVMGDNMATDLDAAPVEAPAALELMTTICGVQLGNNSYYDLTGGREAGGVITPTIEGRLGTGLPFSGMEYYAFGGCPVVNEFDVLVESGPGIGCLWYPDYNSEENLAGIYTDQINDALAPLRTVWVGHSFDAIRNSSGGTLARSIFLREVYDLFDNAISEDITPSELPMAYGLSQNFPNPFNPSTRIQFAMPTKGHVSLKIYNVAGQLVKTLQNGVMDAGSHELTWDGSNNLGSNVASGVYFYKINAGDNYENMKKMVLLR